MDVILVVVGFIGLMALAGWLMAIGLQTAGGLLGIQSQPGPQYTCATCGHTIVQHHTGRMVPGIVMWLNEVGPCTRCACPNYLSMALAGRVDQWEAWRR